MPKINQALLETDFYHTKHNMDLNAVRRQLAKAANQRMVRLEQAVSPISGNNYAFGAYDIAQSYLKDKERHRFSESMKVDQDYDVIREITVLQQFLLSKSSRVGGQKQAEKIRVKTFEAKGVAPEIAASKEFYDFLSSETFNYLSTHGFTSEDIKDIYVKSREAGVSHADVQQAFDDFKDNEGDKSYKGLKEKIEALPVAGSEAG